MKLSIILAAGEGTRMKSKRSKVVHNICGKPLVKYVLDVAEKAGCSKNVIVVGHSKEVLENELKGCNAEFVKQPIGDDVPYGTGFAVMQAKQFINDDDIVVILYGDTPLITEETIDKLIKYHKDEKYNATVLTADLDNPFGYGRIIRDDNGNVTGIVEHKDCSEEQLKIKEINSGIYTFDGKLLKIALENLTNENAQNEYYVTDAISILNNMNYKVGGFKLEDISEIKGVNSRVQLAEAEGIMRRRINERLMLNGVTMINPDSTYIGSEVEIGRDTIIYPGAIIEGKTVIGEDCIIGHNCRIVDSNIGNDVNIQNSTIVESVVGNDTNVGPYAYLRPKSRIGSNVKIGDFVEVKNATIDDYSKASHLAYIGDAEVGKNVNIGCGVVFVNYDGKNKYKTIIEDNAFVGSNSNLVAPVKIKENGFVAAGSTITDDVDKDSLAIARARQVNKKDWIKKDKK